MPDTSPSRLGGAGLAVRGGGAVVERVVDTVKVVLVRSELTQIARTLEANAVLGQRLPRDDRALGRWLRESLRARGARDPALDLWGTAYQIARTRRAAVVRSVGPNQVRDRCASGTSQAAAQRSAGAARDDDVCVAVEASVGSGGARAVDPILGRDSPFRRFEEAR